MENTWHVHEDNLIMDETGAGIAIVLANEQWKNNCHIIAAAPEMLAALEECLIQLANTHSDDSHAYEVAEFAINKAKGV